MCKFASFVLTKDREFWSETGDSYNDIIRENNLNEWGSHGPNIVKVEISPSNKIKNWPSLKAWSFRIDQDTFPEWFDAATVEKRTREALTRRFKHGFKTIYARGCTALTELKADAADYIDASGCNPNLKIKSRRGATIYR